MNQSERLAVYQAQTENVRSINRARIQLNRILNGSIKKGDLIAVDAQTKAMALVFCAWVETYFSKLIHTPYGFTLSEIQQIKEVYQRNGLERGWEKCIDLAIAKVASRNKSNYKPNVRLRIVRLVRQYIVEPSLIRNKIAHGQWKIALNRTNTTVNSELSNALSDLNIVEITIWFGVHEYLARIVEALIESPNKAFARDYWTELDGLENYLLKSKRWTLTEKTKLLRQKQPAKLK